MFTKYGGVSVLSLVVDWLCLSALSSLFNVDISLAGLISYLAGGVINYSLSRRFVFRSESKGRRQIREIILFVASCAIGALLTAIVLRFAAPTIGRHAAKVVAVIVSLVTIYWLRRLVVFDLRTVRVTNSSHRQSANG